MWRGWIFADSLLYFAPHCTCKVLGASAFSETLSSILTMTVLCMWTKTRNIFNGKGEYRLQTRTLWYLLIVAALQLKLQALVYDILPSTTAVFSYTIGSRKLSTNKQFFVGAQTVVSLLQTTQIISDVCFITDHVAYASSNKTKIVWIKTELFF